METRKRAIIDSSDVRLQRHTLYASVLSRVNQAINGGYNLEAITLLESIIADRLESFCNEQTNSNQFAFKMLNQLINESRKYPITDNWLVLLNELNTWRDNRNRFLHEMAKIEEGNNSTFEDKYSNSSAYAVQGKELFHKIDNEIRKYRNKK